MRMPKLYVDRRGNVSEHQTAAPGVLHRQMNGVRLQAAARTRRRAFWGGVALVAGLAVAAIVGR